jgi:hypothetical protein
MVKTIDYAVADIHCFAALPAVAIHCGVRSCVVYLAPCFRSCRIMGARTIYVLRWRTGFLSVRGCAGEQEAGGEC